MACIESVNIRPAVKAFVHDIMERRFFHKRYIRKAVLQCVYILDAAWNDAVVYGHMTLHPGKHE